jgi:hypothetical protein
MGLSFRTGQQVKLGEEIIVLGFPLRGVLSSPPTVTTGIVSSLAGLRDDRTRLQISAPVQPGNSGGPVLDRFGNVVGVVVGKLNALKAMQVTGDIPQNVNFAVHSSIVTSILDSYSISYKLKASSEERPIAEIVARSLSAVVAIECSRERAEPNIALAPTPPGAITPEIKKTAMLCGRDVDYAIDHINAAGSHTRFLGVWTGIWNNASRLCGALIVERVHRDGGADILYIYGPSRTGSLVTWKRQRVKGTIGNNGSLAFTDDQGGTFVFSVENQRTLNALFGGGSGRLTTSFQKAD